MKLVIVESPAKAKTINKYLGKDFKVIASFGHIRDLPSKNGSVLPDDNFAMRYTISDKVDKYVKEITNEASKAEIVYLATDPDREGESISWHVSEIIKEKNPKISDDFFKRIAFNEITKKSILYAIEHPRYIDINLVNAQQARRALDYLVGFTLSPLLWRKLPGCRSAGRVQSVALRLICEREDEIERFNSEEYWNITLKMLNSEHELFSAKLTHVNSVKLEKFSITNEVDANNLVEKIKLKHFYVKSVEKKQQKRQPQPPFITSSLQQEASRKLGFSTKKTMNIAQKLYEGIDLGKETVGLITYMRTDGVTLSTDAIDDIRKLIQKKFGDKYLPTAPRIYKSKAKNAQEAHEAIRPTNINLNPEELKDKLEKDHYKLYDLIWKRTISCQMENVIIDIVVAEFDTEDKEFSARATGSNIAFDGFYKVYRESVEDEILEEEAKILPPLKEGEDIITASVNPARHFTEAPPRYSEASLVKKLEELGIGRPSTYTSILSVLQNRKYATLVKKRFIPEELGRFVTVFLTGFFKKYVEYDFTADLEDDLDKIAGGELEWKSLLRNFWDGFNNNVKSVSEQKITDIINYVEKALDYHLFGKEDENNNSRLCPSCSTGKLSLKLGKFGAFLACSNYPNCTFKKQITSKDEYNNDIDENKLLGIDENGFNIYLKKGPYGLYIQRGGESDSKSIKPKRVPLPSIIVQNNLTLDIAIQLLNLPIKLYDHPDTNEKIMLGIGRYGPYLKYQERFISISKKYDPFVLTKEQVIEIIEANNIKLQNKIQLKEMKTEEKEILPKLMKKKKSITKKVAV